MDKNTKWFIAIPTACAVTIMLMLGYMIRILTNMPIEGSGGGLIVIQGRDMVLFIVVVAILFITATYGLSDAVIRLLVKLKILK